MVCQCVTFMTLLKWDHLTLWGSCIHFFFALFFFLFCFVFVCFCLFFVFVWSRIYPWCEFFLNVTKMHKTYILILQFSTRNVGQIEVEFPIYYVKKMIFVVHEKILDTGRFSVVIIIVVDCICPLWAYRWLFKYLNMYTYYADYL
jgi:hypothetical protein